MGAMMKKLLAFLFILFCGGAQSAQIANVEYIHTAIKQKWDITVPYNSELSNPRVAANMKYLLTAIDVANEILNKSKTTDYSSSEFASMHAADTTATDAAVDRLILKNTDYKLKLTHYYQREGYSGDIRDPNHLIMISAAGTYNINWGDGTREVIEKNTVGEQWFGHDYASDGYYTVRIGGQATKYSDDPDLSTVMLGTSYGCLDEWGWGGKCPLGITDINGCLGCVFPTLEDGSQPRFIDTFAEAYELDIDIPSGLFSGIHGAPVENMFKRTFSYASITARPSDLFAGIQGPLATGVFDATFAFTYIESIPEDLFAGIQGPPIDSMFENTFSGTGITSIPSGLFAGIQGPPAENMFASTFAANFGLESLPEDLFAGIQGPPAENMFTGTFGNTAITSIPSGLFAGIQGPPAEDMFTSTFAVNFMLESIPEDLFAGIQGPPAKNMFTETFVGNYMLQSIPEDLFAGIQGPPVVGMFYGTFESNEALASIPENLFAGIDTTAPYASAMFANTFAYCYNLTGPSARINGQYLYNIWPNVNSYINTYSECNGLDDWDSIPDNWK